MKRDRKDSIMQCQSKSLSSRAWTTPGWRATAVAMLLSLAAGPVQASNDASRARAPQALLQEYKRAPDAWDVSRIPGASHGRGREERRGAHSSGIGPRAGGERSLPGSLGILPHGGNALSQVLELPLGLLQPGLRRA